MKYLSVCSGIEAATVAWHHMGWQPVAFSEIEPFPSAVLAHHYPNVPNVGDMTKFQEWNLEPIDLLVGGTPCQSFSVAGLRKGLADPRGNLMLTYLAIAERHRPEWLVWENVPGVLSSNGGRDFGTFLGALGQLGYGFAYRVLDAQYFGVAQRRRRVFVVANARDWRRAAAVLFDSESLRGNPAPSREKGQEVAGTIAARFGISRNNHEECVAQTWPTDIAPTLNAAFGSKQGLEDQHALGGAGLFVPAITFGAQHSRGSTDFDMVQTLQAKNPMAVAVAFDTYNQTVTGDTTQTLCSRGDSPGGNAHLVPAVAQPVAIGLDEEQNAVVDGFGTLKARTASGGFEGVIAQPMAVNIMQVRRLTPVECERLQGFPDGYTNIPWRKKPESPDGPRYKALGNSMAVPVMRWIGERINMVPK